MHHYAGCGRNSSGWRALWRARRQPGGAHDRGQIPPRLLEVIVNYNVIELRAWLISSSAAARRRWMTSSRVLAARAQAPLELVERGRQDEDADRVGKEAPHLLRALPVDLEQHVVARPRASARSAAARCRRSCRGPRRSRGTRPRSSMRLERRRGRRSGSRGRPPRPAAARASCTRSTARAPGRRPAPRSPARRLARARRARATMKRSRRGLMSRLTRGSAPARASARSGP